MKWISVEERVPDNRRKVLVWGFYSYHDDASHLGFTRYNKRRDGSGEFDCEWVGSRVRMQVCTVTHWAEIEGPQDEGGAAS